MTGFVAAAALVLDLTGCAGVQRRGLYEQARKYGESGNPRAAIQQLNLLLTYGDPEPELEAQIPLHKARWSEASG